MVGNFIVRWHDRYCSLWQVRLAQVVFWGGLVVLLCLELVSASGGH